jgi:class 3 adenylate cyclase/outer membrane protein OmpA-like peptidoglycan-associated protein
VTSEARERVERRLAAILTADVVGYSRLMGRDEVGTHVALKAVRRELVDPRIREHHGRIFKTTGDGLLVEFASVVDAVRCAVALQREMAGRNAEVPLQQRMEFRIGINLGDVIVDEDDVFGDGVNVAARLEPLAEPGGICISAVVRDQVRDKLDFAFEDMGDQQVKNIARPVRVYRIPIAGKAATNVPKEIKPTKNFKPRDLYQRLGTRFGARYLLTLICLALSAIVIPKSLGPLLPLGERAVTNTTSQIEAAVGGQSRTIIAGTPVTPSSEGRRSPADQIAQSPMIGEPVLFERGKVIITPPSGLTIDRQAAFLRDNPKVTVTIEGHCSEDEGAREGPSVLAQLRANQVRNALKERGIADNRIQTISYGQSRPAVVGNGEAAQAQNRRAVVLQN